MSTLTQPSSPYVDRVVHDILADLADDSLNLPSLPAVIFRVREVVADPASSLDDVARTVAADPALATRLLRVANSAYYGASRRVSSLPEAVARLGDDVIEHTALLLVVADLYHSYGGARIRPHLAALWGHSVEVAALARGLARAAGVRPDVAMLAGLVHDVGVLPVLAWADENPTLLNSRDLFERVVADVHTLLGRAILHRWQFPAALVEAVAEHEDWRRDRGPAPDLTDLVVVANLLSLNGGSPPDPEQVPAWRKLAPGEEETRALWEQAQADAGQLRRLLYG